MAVREGRRSPVDRLVGLLSSDRVPLPALAAGDHSELVRVACLQVILSCDLDCRFHGFRSARDEEDTRQIPWGDIRDLPSKFRLGFAGEVTVGEGGFASLLLHCLCNFSRHRVRYSLHAPRYTRQGIAFPQYRRDRLPHRVKS